MPEETSTVASFGDMNLPAPILSALNEVGYETPSPIQAQTIPFLLDGLDLLGHAPTGTGKTAAFAVPLMSRIDLTKNKVQILVLAPTRELAIQVSEAFARYGSQLPGFRVLPIYGGQEYGSQIRQLSRGVHVVVGTPGRVMDHMRKATLKLDSLQAVVLDEADEMLRMGFIDDVQWILDQTPAKRQMALFSATMPREIQKIAQRYLKEPKQISIKAKTATAETIRQRYWPVSGMHKLDALTRILEFESFDAMLVFVRTRIATSELAERLAARGYASAAINGDMVQKNREQTIERLKSGALDILVATDVAARGLDVDRISHVVNYDIPYDTESYIHRIGRTGRAGRRGDAILFVSPREKRMLGAIERATRQKIEQLELPTTEMVNNKRIAKFMQGISDTLAAGDLSFMQRMVEQYQQEHDVPAIEIAAALARQAIGDRELLLKPGKDKPFKEKEKGFKDDDRGRGKPYKEGKGDREFRPRRERAAAVNGADSNAGEFRTRREKRREQFGAPTGVSRSGGDGSDLVKRRPDEFRRPAPGDEAEQFRLEVGLHHGVKPGNIVGAIANEAGLDSRHINKIEIFDDHSLVNLPVGMPSNILKDLRKAWVCGQKLNISRVSPIKGKSLGDLRDELNPKRDKTKPKNKNKNKNKKDKLKDKSSRKPKRNFESKPKSD